MKKNLFFAIIIINSLFTLKAQDFIDLRSFNQDLGNILSNMNSDRGYSSIENMAIYQDQIIQYELRLYKETKLKQLIIYATNENTNAINNYYRSLVSKYLKEAYRVDWNNISFNADYKYFYIDCVFHFKTTPLLISVRRVISEDDGLMVMFISEDNDFSKYTDLSEYRYSKLSNIEIDNSGPNATGTYIVDSLLVNYPVNKTIKVPANSEIILYYTYSGFTPVVTVKCKEAKYNWSHFSLCYTNVPGIEWELNKQYTIYDFDIFSLRITNNSNKEMDYYIDISKRQ